ncbi:hypothetical protein CABS01_04153 [Colletotrichum abscissum]|uniref:Uncharacterized protein n=1 Tax=Colletotrichum abscissum TaxID=1671311 RepID=A0A9P9X8B9_9PEZI|nr:uncharacterized protein CABS01_04153 [Colletotrichum abscissum]KAI3542676.1 hypothetical protein CABS02_10296 [Colletotrichum abscissum]KAK1473491.1 hypothetical protein CABS01_04153 [Colletotrichum abscissum]
MATSFWLLSNTYRPSQEWFPAFPFRLLPERLAGGCRRWLKVVAAGWDNHRGAESLRVLGPAMLSSGRRPRFTEQTPSSSSTCHGAAAATPENQAKRRTDDEDAFRVDVAVPSPDLMKKKKKKKKKGGDTGRGTNGMLHLDLRLGGTGVVSKMGSHGVARRREMEARSR